MTGPPADHLPRPVTPSDGPVEVMRDILATVKRGATARCGSTPVASTASR
ncbi:MAG: hypothetical protein R2695_12205 [Acidimicrobiales bacterium]